MLPYIIRRILLSLLMVLCVGTIIFFPIHLVPGDPVDVILSGGGSGGSTQEQREALRHTLGLDQPIYQQYWRWITHMMQGDFGVSPIKGRKVIGDILNQFPQTIELILGSLIIAVLIGVPGGIIAAIRSNSKYDLPLTTLSLLGLSIPNFVVGTMLILLFGLYLQWMPLTGYISLWEHPWRHLQLLFFPCFSLGLAFGAVVLRMTRSSMLDVLGQDYIRTARAKGLTEFLVNYQQALRNALIPVVTLTGLQMGALLGGTVVVEYVFNWPGLSTLLIQGVWQRDYPMVQGVVMLISACSIFINLAVDIINAWLDPRITYK